MLMLNTSTIFNPNSGFPFLKISLHQEQIQNPTYRAAPAFRIPWKLCTLTLDVLLFDIVILHPC